MNTLTQHLPTWERSLYKAVHRFFDARDSKHVKLKELLCLHAQEIDVSRMWASNLPWSFQLDLDLEAYSIGLSWWQRLLIWWQYPPDERHSEPTHKDGITNLTTNDLYIGAPRWLQKVTGQVRYHPLRVVLKASGSDCEEITVCRQVYICANVPDWKMRKSSS